MPYQEGRALVWDYTCTHRLAESYRVIALHEGPTVANQAGDRKMSKYRDLAEIYIVQPIAFETLGGIGESSLKFL